MDSICRSVNAVIGWACRTVLYLTITSIFLILSFNVFLRYGSGTSIQWASEVPELLFPWLVMAGVVLAAQHGVHISVVFLTQHLPDRIRRWVLMAGGLIVVASYASLVLAAWSLMPIAADELTPILHVPGSATVACLLIGFALLAVVALTQIHTTWSALRSSADESAAASAASLARHESAFH